MSKDKVFVTIDHIDDYSDSTALRVGDILTLKKDHDNYYDDEAIVAYGKHKNKCGYVANSVPTVARGTYSAGRVYDKIKEDQQCVIRFITEECLIGELIE